MTRPARQRQQAEAAGRRAEWLAAWYLRLKGYRILTRNRRGRRGGAAGEVDIVARRGRTVAFIEVKRRADRAEALAAIGPRQQERITRAAARFLAATPEAAGCDIRFDALLLAPGRLPRHIRGAWQPATPF